MFSADGCSIKDKNGKCIANVKSSGGVYRLPSNANDAVCMLSATNDSAMTWHRRLAHINHGDLCKMRDGAVDGIKFTDGAEEVKRCEVCMQGKQARLPFKASVKRAKHALDLLHSDLCGLTETISIGGARYLLTFIDDFSRKVFVYFLRSKSEVLERFREFKRLVEIQTERKVKAD